MFLNMNGLKQRNGILIFVKIMVKLKSIFKIQNLNQNALNIQSWSGKDGWHINKVGVFPCKGAEKGLTDCHIAMREHQNIEGHRVCCIL